MTSSFFNICKLLCYYTEALALTEFTNLFFVRLGANGAEEERFRFISIFVTDITPTTWSNTQVFINIFISLPLASILIYLLMTLLLILQGFFFLMLCFYKVLHQEGIISESCFKYTVENMRRKMFRLCVTLQCRSGENYTWSMRVDR